MQTIGIEDRSSKNICCVPTECHINKPIDNLSEAVRVICNNENCMEGEYMHKICFDHWEETVLTYLRSTGRARSWSEKQRLQNLWTKKGYDLAYKACSCKCGKGHLRKDLDWVPPQVPALQENNGKRKKNRKKKNDKPTLSLTVTVSKPTFGAPTSQQIIPVAPTRLRSSSISSTGSAACSPPNSSSFFPLSPSYNGKNSLSEQRERHHSECIFSRRQDYSSFNTLPRNKINSYHIKIEDEGNQGNDEIRCFILSTLSANKTVGINCIFCYSHMIIFDRYPLIDGTFFISPQQYSSGSIPVTVDCQTQYLNAICMGCLEGWNARLMCRYCQTKWNGSDLILGTMYSYDVIVAKPCCQDRLKCKNCKSLIILPANRFQFFSEYSRIHRCGTCGNSDYHFIKPLSTFILQTRSNAS